MKPMRIFAAILSLAAGCDAFRAGGTRASAPRPSPTRASASAGNLHGESSCFLPLLQNDEEYIAPRIVQIAGSYPGADASTYLSLPSEPSAALGQWAYDFPDPASPGLGTVALPGLNTVYETEDPVVLIAGHDSLGVQLPEELTEPVDLLVLCDRARTTFEERRFLVLGPEGGGGELTIAAFERRGDVPEGARILGHVTLVQIPWLPSMKKRKTGFMEEEQLF